MIFGMLSNRENINIYLINASSIIEPYLQAERDRSLTPTEFEKFRDLGTSLFSLEPKLNKYDTYYFTSYHSNYLLATSTIAIQNQKIDKIPQNIVNLHLIKTFEYISRNVYLEKLNINDLFTINNDLSAKEPLYFKYFGLSPSFLKNTRFKTIIYLFDQISFNVGNSYLEFIIRYDYLFLLRKYMKIQGILNPSDQIETHNNNKNNNIETHNNNKNNKNTTQPSNKGFTNPFKAIKNFFQTKKKVKTSSPSTLKAPTQNPHTLQIPNTFTTTDPVVVPTGRNAVAATRPVVLPNGRNAVVPNVNSQVIVPKVKQIFRTKTNIPLSRNRLTKINTSVTHPKGTITNQYRTLTQRFMNTKRNLESIRNRRHSK
jgi:hypothetical protein